MAAFAPAEREEMLVVVATMSKFGWMLLLKKLVRLVRSAINVLIRPLVPTKPFSPLIALCTPTQEISCVFTIVAALAPELKAVSTLSALVSWVLIEGTFTRLVFTC